MRAMPAPAFRPPFRAAPFRTAPLVCAALLSWGCAHHQPPEEALVAELDGAAIATFERMGLDARQRPGERELQARMALIAAHADPERVAAVRAGRLDERRLREDYHAALQRRDARQDLDPPLLLAALERAGAAWTPAQCLLFDALLAQYAAEAGLAKPVPELTTGTR
jgi:hypothetical protein